ncbi:hydantoinase/dihydropyrimidinase family protein [Aspergillus stella-maris]|uniref:hydantoinase/dihydropyrimidinase family protein n=1 Tax=Aspergillus stella-maris TaxID=1810926 RepID=UPI003CCE2AD0
MADIELIITNATIATASDILPNTDIAISNGKIALLGTNLPSLFPNAPTLSADGAYVLPGGVDSHVHLQQDNSPTGDTWETGTRSAIAGGTTTVLAFASQKRTDESLFPVVEEYHRRADGNAYCDYGFHLILSNPTEPILDNELPVLVRDEGISSVKLYMTYQPMRLRDSELLDVMSATRALGMTTMIHAENADMIDWMTKRLEARGRVEPYAHALARPNIAEDEATYRALSLAQLADVPILIVHMSSSVAAGHVRRAQTKLLPVHAETCPHYLFFTAEKLRGEHFHGAMCVCSPALRESPMDLDAMWDGLVNGTFTTFSSDHAPSKFDHPLGKKKGTSTFTQIPNGLPGLETRMPSLFSAGVQTGRLTIQKFVELTASNPAKLYGLSNCKGTIAPGFDADLVIWYPTPEQAKAAGSPEKAMKPFKLSNDMLHHDIDYTPFEGMEFGNWPRYTILRGKVVFDRDNGGIKGVKGDGAYLKRGRSTLSAPRGVFVNEFNPYEGEAQAVAEA